MYLIGPQTLAERWGVPLTWVYSKCRTRDLPHVKLGRYVRFDLDELDGWVAQHHRDVKPDATAGVAKTATAST
jgi:excisionase family DNA binding protein